MNRRRRSLDTHTPEQPHFLPHPHPRNNTPAQKETTTLPRNKVTFAPLPPQHINTNIYFQYQADSDIINNSTVNTNTSLMVIQAQAKNELNNKTEHAYAILDSASDQSFISSSLASRLQLDTEYETIINVNTFGGRAEVKKVKHITVALLNENGHSIEVSLLTVDTLTHILTLPQLPMEDQLFLSQTHPHLEKALSQDSSMDIIPDILLGIDYFHKILLTNEPVISLPSGYFITPTIFGPVISGNSATITLIQQNHANI
ncbi:hypothetical protein V3C99_000489 [Haemonchus contortus]